ncbi:hypothetical protein D9758_004729 [Tetrapyrgos nigripes]|uniref:Uncharacterized protein n=1 Tax=Tetrapyrgos nigripes TaxID=182062 RepID=A0A8H5H0M3_9AGAR|nr:hypothetical protein D9758_004729 [Tetrapyrgos nigripes]
MNSSSNAQQQLPPLNLSIGSIQVAERFVIFLFGIGTIQTIIFFKTNKYIFYWNKIAVFLVWLLSVIHVLTTSHLTYHYLVTTRGDLEGPLVGSYTANIVAQVVALVKFDSVILFPASASKYVPRYTPKQLDLMQRGSIPKTQQVSPSNTFYLGPDDVHELCCESL